MLIEDKVLPNFFGTNGGEQRRAEHEPNGIEAATFGQRGCRCRQPVRMDSSSMPSALRWPFPLLSSSSDLGRLGGIHGRKLKAALCSNIVRLDTSDPKFTVPVRPSLVGKPDSAFDWLSSLLSGERVTGPQASRSFIYVALKEKCSHGNDVVYICLI